MSGHLHGTSHARVGLSCMKVCTYPNREQFILLPNSDTSFKDVGLATQEEALQPLYQETKDWCSAVNVEWIAEQIVALGLVHMHAMTPLGYPHLVQRSF